MELYDDFKELSSQQAGWLGRQHEDKSQVATPHYTIYLHTSNHVQLAVTEIG